MWLLVFLAAFLLAPPNACPGFAVLTFKNGELLPPELCEVRGDKAFFRNEQVV